MRCHNCDGKGEIFGWIHRPCAYCGGTGKLPDDFFEMTKLKRCKKCGGEAVFSGVFDDPKTYRFPECIECGARAEGNSVKDNWYERARKWNEQNTQTNEEWFCGLPTEEKAKAIVCLAVNAFHKKKKETDVDKIKQWLQEEHRDG